jgi:hypothetical protein
MGTIEDNEIFFSATPPSLNTREVERLKEGDSLFSINPPLISHFEHGHFTVAQTH